MVHPDLRRELGMEDQALHLIAEKGHVQILTEALYLERKRRAIERSTPSDLELSEEWKGSGDRCPLIIQNRAKRSLRTSAPTHYPGHAGRVAGASGMIKPGWTLSSTVPPGWVVIRRRSRLCFQERSRVTAANSQRTIAMLNRSKWRGGTPAAEWADRIGVSTGEFLRNWRIESDPAESGRVDSGPWSEPVSAYGCGAGIFISGGRAPGHAHGSNPGRDSGRTAEPQCRKGNRRLALPARRRKESAEDSRSNRSSAAHSEHTTPGGCGGTGRTSDGTSASRARPRTFMALRMVVNREQEAALDALPGAAPRLVRPGWPDRHHLLFMSLWKTEKVKESFREAGSVPDRGLILTKKPLTPSEQEVRENPPSRSAKLRAVEIRPTWFVANRRT